jgi:glutamate 5-kinase
VVKIGSSSVTRSDGTLAEDVIGRIAAEVASVMASGTSVLVVSSGAVAAGWARVGAGRQRPSDVSVLQAVSAVGQPWLMSAWSEAFGRQGSNVGQVLLAPNDFADRQQYLQGRQTLEQLLKIGVVPIINENDAVADDELRFGDNDRLAALVAQMVGADRLVILTDTPGLLTADPRIDADATLIEEVAAFDRSLDEMAGGPGSAVGSGGMASKLAAARLATFSGVATIIASAATADVIVAANAGDRLEGTLFHPRSTTLSARKLWIAFALGSIGRITIDEGAADALLATGGSLLAQGVVGVDGAFEAGAAVEILGPGGSLLAKGLVRMSAAEVAESTQGVIVHRDDLAVLVESSETAP